jgi:hypothetical protein
MMLAAGSAATTPEVLVMRGMLCGARTRKVAATTLPFQIGAKSAEWWEA